MWAKIGVGEDTVIVCETHYVYVPWILVLNLHYKERVSFGLVYLQNPAECILLLKAWLPANVCKV